MRTELKLIKAVAVASACACAVGAYAGDQSQDQQQQPQQQQQQPVLNETLKDLPNVLVISVPETTVSQQQGQGQEQGTEQGQPSFEQNAESPEIILLRVDNLPMTETGDIDNEQLAQIVDSQQSNAIEMPVQDLITTTMSDDQYPSVLQQRFDDANSLAKARWDRLAWHFYRDIIADNNNHHRDRGFYGYGYQPRYSWDRNDLRHQPRYGWYDNGRVYDYDHSFGSHRRYDGRGYRNDYYYYGRW